MTYLYYHITDGYIFLQYLPTFLIILDDIDDLYTNTLTQTYPSKAVTVKIRI